MARLESKSDDRQIGRREIILSSLLLAMSVAGHIIKLKPGSGALTPDQFRAVTPLDVGHYRYSGEGGVVLPLEDELSKLIYSNMRYGNYSDGIHTPIMLLVAYDKSQEYDLQIHRPEACYPASGFAITNRRTFPTDKILGVASQGTFLTATRQDRTEQVLYWTRIGTEFPTDSASQRWSTISSKFAGTVPDAVLFRMSTISSDQEASLVSLLTFTKLLMRQMSGRTREIYLGSTQSES